MNTLDYITQKFSLDLTQPSPVNIESVNRKVMAETLAELGFTVGAEIGVAAGDHSKTLLESIPSLTLYCVDTWTADRSYWSFRSSTLANWYELAKIALSPYPNCIIKKQTSMEVARSIPNETLDFVYIDAAHDFKNIAMDICEWSKKVRPGGIVYGHDYTVKFARQYACHVKYIVDAYMWSYQISPWFVLGENRRPNRTGVNDIPEWLYIK